MNLDSNESKMNVFIVTSRLTTNDETELNDNKDIKIAIILASNFSSEDIIKFLVDVSEKLPITIVCALLKEAIMKFLRKKIKPAPNKLSIIIKKTENKDTYTIEYDFPTVQIKLKIWAKRNCFALLFFVIINL